MKVESRKKDERIESPPPIKTAGVRRKTGNLIRKIKLGMSLRSRGSMKKKLYVREPLG